MTTHVYRDVTIEKTLTGWYSALIPGRGYMKTETLRDMKYEILHTCIDCHDPIGDDGTLTEDGDLTCAECVKFQS